MHISIKLHLKKQTFSKFVCPRSPTEHSLGMNSVEKCRGREQNQPSQEKEGYYRKWRWPEKKAWRGAKINQELWLERVKEWTESGRVLNWGIITLTAEIECAGSKSKSGENVGEGGGVRRWDLFLTQRQCMLWKAPELWNQTFPFECQRCHLPLCNLGVWGSIPFPAAGKQNR